LNPNKTQRVGIQITGQDFTTANGEIVTAQNMNDYNDFGREEKVTLKPFEVKKPKDGKLSVELPSKSVVLIRLN
jgi:alpha-N-arabinofuranosidase